MQLLRTLVITTTLLIAALPARAEYAPDTIEFPASAPLVFTSESVLSLTSGGAIEFWVVADWTESPGYHPVVLANGSAELPIYQLSIAAERDALLVQAGADFGRFPFDFSDGSTHHVALLDFDEQIVAMIDGKLAGAVAMSIEPGAVGHFVIGSAAGGVRPFVGAVSALRIWDIPLEPEQIPMYALRDAHDPTQPHPNLDNLVGKSDFRNGTFEIVESVVFQESELMTRAEAIAILGEEEVLAMELEFGGEENDE